MAEGGFSKLSYGQIQSMAGQLNSSATSMSDILNKIESELNKIGDDGVWSGTAAAGTKQEFDTLIKKFPEFSKAVLDCSTYLNKVVENYQSVDSTVRGS